MKKLRLLLMGLAACGSAFAQVNDSINSDYLILNSIDLDEVVIKSNLPKTRLKGDAMVSNIVGSSLEKIGDATQLLARIPSLKVKGNSVSVLGRGEAEVYINGRKVRDKKELDKMQSDKILRVEVVQNPGAKYAAGTTAVVRIVLRKPTGEGFGFTETAEYANRHGEEWSNDIDMNYRRGGLDIGAELFYDKASMGEKSESEQLTYLDRTWSLKSLEDLAMKMNFWAPTLTLNYQINDENSLGVRWQYFREPRGENVGSSVSQLFADGVLQENNISRPGGVDNSWSHDVGAYYTGKLGKLSLEFNYDWYRERTNDVSITHEQDGTTENVVHTYSLTNNQMHAAKLVAGYPLLGGELSFGGEFNRSTRANGYRNPEGLVADDNNEVKEQISAAFFEYNRELGPLSLNVGLRYERTASDYYQEGKKSDEQSRLYTDWFPAAGISAQLGKTWLQLAYSSEIERPSYFDLGSAVWYINKYTYMSGNPLLRPSYTNSLSLTASWQWLTATVGYKRIKDEVAMLSRPFAPDKPMISLQTSENIDPYNQAYATLVIQPRIGIWSPQLQLAGYLQDYKAETPDGMRRLRTPYATIDWLNMLEFKRGWQLNCDMHFASRGDASNSSILKNSWHMDFGVIKTLLKNRLECHLAVRDLFATQCDRMMTFTGNRVTLFESTPYRHVTLTVKYKFNATKSNYKGEGAGESQKGR